MKPNQTNRTRLIGLRLTEREYELLHARWKKTTCRKLSDYVRRSLFDKPVTTMHRNQSLDELMEEAARLRSELNGVATNFNQAVKKLHSLRQIEEFRDWLLTNELERQTLLAKMEQIKKHIQKIAEHWLSQPW